MKFGKRFAQALPEELAPFALPYTPLKQYLKALVVSAADGTALQGDESGETSSGGEGYTSGGLLDTSVPSLAFKPTSRQVADFQQRLKEGLDAPAQLAERLCADLTTEMGTLQPCRDGVEDDRLPALLERVEQLHCFVVLNYVAVFKLVKKWNKASACASPGAQLSAVSLLLPSPIFSSRQVQLLFQRAAKWRHEGSQHGAGVYAAAAAAAAASRPSGAPSSGGPSSPTSQPPLPISAMEDAGTLGAGISAPLNMVGSSGALSVGSGDGSTGGLPFSSSLGAGLGALGGGLNSSTAPVQCEGCVRMQTRFVALGCSHTFCWGCIAAALVQQRRRAERAPGSSSALALHRGSGGSLSGMDTTAMAPPQSPRAAPGGLVRRLSASSAAFSSWPEPLPEGATYMGPRSPSAGAWPGGGGSDHPLLECPICDSMEDLDQGHLEVNTLLSDDSFVWILSHDGETCGNRRGSSRSRLAGIDFANLNVNAGGSGSYTEDGGVLGSTPTGQHPASPLGPGKAALPGRWGHLGRVPSWESMGAPQR